MSIKPDFGQPPTCPRRVKTDWISETHIPKVRTDQKFPHADRDNWSWWNRTVCPKSADMKTDLGLDHVLTRLVKRPNESHQLFSYVLSRKCLETPQTIRRKINRTWQNSYQFWRWSGCISTSSFRLFLWCVVQKMHGTPKFYPFYWVKTVPKWEKSTDHDKNLISMVRIHQDAMWQVIPPIYCQEIALKPQICLDQMS